MNPNVDLHYSNKYQEKITCESICSCASENSTPKSIKLLLYFIFKEQNAVIK